MFLVLILRWSKYVYTVIKNLKVISYMKFKHSSFTAELKKNILTKNKYDNDVSIATVGQCFTYFLFFLKNKHSFQNEITNSIELASS